MKEIIHLKIKGDNMRKQIMILCLLSAVLFGCQTTSDGPSPPQENIVGHAYFQTPFDVDQLANEGYLLDSGWNTFYWPSDLTGVNVTAVFGDLMDDFSYIYNYNDMSYYFSPKGMYAYLRNDTRYKQFTRLQSGKNYGIRMNNAATLKYGEADEAEEQTTLWKENGNKVYYSDGEVGIGTSYPIESLTISNGTILIEELAGKGNAFVCVDENGRLFRSNISCS